MQQNFFCSEAVLSKFLSSIDIIPEAFKAISTTPSERSRQKLGEIETSVKMHYGKQILAFNCPNDYYPARSVNQEFVIVSSKNRTSVDFILTKVNTEFSISSVAVNLFECHNPEDIVNKVKLDSPLIITGRGLEGYVAILFTLWLQNVIDEKESANPKIKFKRPICITFGTPLVGDVSLQRAISERPQWTSSFLNVVGKKDYIASIFSSNNSDYKPFGTFMFWTESGGHSAFEDQESVLAVLDVMASLADGNEEKYDYVNVLSSIKRKVLYRGVCDQLGGLNMNPLKAGITLQFREIDVLNEISNDPIEEMEKKQIKKFKRKKNVYEPTKTLNEMKINLTYLEWYMKLSEREGGYYDRYKNATNRYKNATNRHKNETIYDEIEKQQEITKRIRMLNQYWSNMVNEKNLMPQKEGSKLRKRWLLGGTNYRRIVEPLYIADYYHKDKRTNYIENRDEHFNLLEIWANGETKDSGPRTKAASLTEDSCFWAHVEEALILLKNLRSGESSTNTDDKLEKFKADFMIAIKNYSVSPAVFLEGSSLMKWWKEYKEYIRGSYATTDKFAQYMNNKEYETYM